MLVFTNIHICFVGSALGEVVRTNLFVLPLIGLLAFTKQPVIINNVCYFALYLGLVNTAWTTYVTLDFMFDRRSKGRSWYKLAPYLKWIDPLFGSPSDAVLRNVYSGQCLTIFLLSNAIFTGNASVWILLLYGLNLVFCTIYTLRHMERYDRIQRPVFGFMQTLFCSAVQGFSILLHQWHKGTVPVYRLWAFVTTCVFCIGSVSPAYCAGEAAFDVPDERPLGQGHSVSTASRNISAGVRQASEVGQRMASSIGEFAAESVRESAADLRKAALTIPSRAVQGAVGVGVGYGVAQMSPDDGSGPSGTPDTELAEQYAVAQQKIQTLQTRFETLEADNTRLQNENAQLNQQLINHI